MPEIIRHLLISLDKEGVEAGQLFTPEKEAAILVSTVKEKMEPRTPVEPRFKAAVKHVEAPKATAEEPVEVGGPAVAAPEEVTDIAKPADITKSSPDASPRSTGATIGVLDKDAEERRREELDKKLDELLKDE